MTGPKRAPGRQYLFAALASFGLLVTNYALAVVDGEWPRNHPWLGISTLTMGVFFLCQRRPPRSRGAVVAIALLPVIAVAALAILMLQRTAM